MIRFKNKQDPRKHYIDIQSLIPVSAPTWAKFGHGENVHYRRIHMWAKVEVAFCTKRDYYDGAYDASIEIVGCIAPTQAEGRCHSLKPIDVFTMGMPEYVNELPY